jgi:hypothetical protein
VSAGSSCESAQAPSSCKPRLRQSSLSVPREDDPSWSERSANGRAGRALGLEGTDSDDERGSPVLALISHPVRVDSGSLEGARAESGALVLSDATEQPGDES